MTTQRDRTRGMARFLTVAVLVSTLSLGGAALAQESPGAVLANETAAPQNPRPHLTKPIVFDMERVAALERAGHNRSEILTAISLEEQTDVQAEVWLEGRRQGKEWLALIEELAPGVVLVKRPMVTNGRAMTEAEMREMMAQGYNMEAIFTAGELMFMYGSDLQTLLARNKNGESWEAIAEAVPLEWRAAQVSRPRITGLGTNGTQTKTSTGWTLNEINALVAQGYDPTELLRADQVAARFGFHIRDLIKHKRPDQTFENLIWEARFVGFAKKSTPPAVYTGHVPYDGIETEF